MTTNLNGATAELPKRKRRWFQYSLRTFFVGMFTLTVFIAWWSRSALRQKEAVKTIVAVGGAVQYDFEYRQPSGAESPIPGRLLQFFGVDCFHNVVAARMEHHGRDELLALPHLQVLTVRLFDMTNEDLHFVGDCRQLKEVWFHGAPSISDAGIRHLGKLADLEVVFLPNAIITEDGIRALAKLRRLKTLTLPGAALTKEALAEMGSMTQLNRLSLAHAMVITAEGRQRLPGVTKLGDLKLGGVAPLTDDELPSLACLTNLTDLDLRNSWRVSDQGLKHLTGLTNLTALRLDNTAISSDGLQRIQAALPKCTISAKVTMPTLAGSSGGTK